MSKNLTSQATDFPRWYTEIVQRADLAEHAPVKGSMIIKPYGYGLWENIQKELDKMFKDTGHENAYFPVLIPESFMAKEAEHVEGFAPELAIVTHAGGKKLEEAYVIRPTSETIIWNAYRDWIQSHRDLPILINQWANVMRWEMRTRLFLRTTEFLWQEGHTAHATAEEAQEETMKMLEVYRAFAEEYMAMPVLTGVKTERERFAGAVNTYCIEALMGDKKALQAGTSHNLGQNFAKAFDVQFQDKDSKRKYVYATSWGVSTRLVGAIVMAHGDDKGLIMPPKLAPLQSVIVPIFRKDDEKARVMEACEKLLAELKKQDIRCKIDNRDQRPGWKFAEWELKGVPVRIDIGPRDLDSDEVTLALRFSGEKVKRKLSTLAGDIPQLLDECQKGLFERALKHRTDNTHRVDTWDEFKNALELGGFIEAHWDGSSETEEQIQNETKATIRCIPFDAKEEDGVCIRSGRPSKRRVVFAKAY